jgi:uncharacterized membrane protein
LESGRHRRPFVADRYPKAWRDLQGRRRLFVALLLLNLALAITLMLADAASMNLGLPLHFVALVVGLSVMYFGASWVQRFRCPKCGRRFLEGRGQWSQTCGGCGARCE